MFIKGNQRINARWTNEELLLAVQGKKYNIVLVNYQIY